MLLINIDRRKLCWLHMRKYLSQFTFKSASPVAEKALKRSLFSARTRPFKGGIAIFRIILLYKLAVLMIGPKAITLDSGLRHHTK